MKLQDAQEQALKAIEAAFQEYARILQANTLEFDRHSLYQIDELRQKTNASSTNEILERALSVYFSIVLAREQDKDIMFKDRTGFEQCFVLPHGWGPQKK